MSLGIGAMLGYTAGTMNNAASYAYQNAMMFGQMQQQIYYQPSQGYQQIAPLLRSVDFDPAVPHKSVRTNQEWLDKRVQEMRVSL